MRLFSLVIILFPHCLLAKSIFYSDQLRSVDLRAQNPSLLLFEAPVITVSCQPAHLEFESLSDRDLAIDERNQVKAQSMSETTDDEPRLLMRMLRAKPLVKSGPSLCTFVLTNGDEISVEFNPKEEITTPLIHFRPFEALENNLGKQHELKLLVSLLKGKPLDVLEKRSENRVCSPIGQGPHICRNATYDTDIASYEFIFIGKNSLTSAWTIKATLKKPARFKQVADFKAKRGLISHSLTTPQNENFNTGSILHHHLIGHTSLTLEEFKDILL